MTCPHCNNPDPGSGKFCIHCGQSLPQQPAPTPAPPLFRAEEPEAVQSPPAHRHASGLPRWNDAPPPKEPAPVRSWPKQETEVKSSDSSVTRVIVTDINMDFRSMVVFMVKWTIATIPAALILLAIVGLFILVFGGILSACSAMIF